MENKYQAALIHDPDSKLNDKFQLAREFLDTDPYLIVFNDFHQISQTIGFEDFFTQVVLRASNIKILLTSRIRPECLDHPEWPPGSAVEILLPGLPKEHLPEYVQDIELTDDQIQKIWTRTSGNPFALGILSGLLRNRPWEEQIDDLPLFDDKRSKAWAESLIESLDKDVRTKARKIAVVRASLNIDFIGRMIYASPENTKSFIEDLLDAYVMYLIGIDEYKMYDYIREALLSDASEKDLVKAHRTAGSYFQQFAEVSQDPLAQCEELIECLYHYEKADSFDEIFLPAETAHSLLLKLGDRERALKVAKTGSNAGNSCSNHLMRVYWLSKVVKGELDLNQLDNARLHLDEAFKQFPSDYRKLSEAQITEWRVLEAEL